VASNFPDAKTHMQHRFKDSIAIFGDERRNSVEGVQFALLEFLLLSRTALLIHTLGSTFAEEAAQVNLRPLVGIFAGRLLRHTDINLINCGNQHFSGYPPSTSRQERKEEIPRKMSFLDCGDFLGSWGLSDVMCQTNS
jgi:hypothetical protein